jgi:hypothetical protein
MALVMLLADLDVIGVAVETLTAAFGIIGWGLIILGLVKLLRSSIRMINSFRVGGGIAVWLYTILVDP